MKSIITDVESKLDELAGSIDETTAYVKSAFAILDGLDFGRLVETDMDNEDLISLIQNEVGAAMTDLYLALDKLEEYNS